MDEGVMPKNIHIIFIVLLSQLFLFVGSGIMDVLNNRIMLFLSTKIGITIISEYLKKLMKLPIKFFESKLAGDLIERANDHERIERFLTSQSFFTLFSFLNFSVFFFVLAYYNIKILLCYLILTVTSIGWYFIFNRRRQHMDYQRFRIRSENLERRYELLTSMQEIKLNTLESYKENQWKKIQEKLFSINLKILNIDLKRSTGYKFINNLKNILVTYIAAYELIQNNLTIGSMLSISYIIGEMNSPINQLISFFQSWHDAKISSDRMIEIQQEREEEANIPPIPIGNSLNSVYSDQSLKVQNLSFQYGGPKSTFVLQNINILIPQGRVTAIVGASGSGKTTLMKLLLKFYEPVIGDIFLGEKNLKEVSHRWLRRRSGVVMQDGFIFGDTIERNIAGDDEKISYTRLQDALHIANIKDFVESLPLGLNTKVGASGNGVSGGQKQRILIARAVYKNPQFLFLDEATSAMDAENERIIHDNMQSFFKGKTVVIIAHRLSTVKNADQIIVLKNGQIVEKGSHRELVPMKNEYYNLVKNQLELGS